MSSILPYGAICVITTLIGLGVLRMLRVPRHSGELFLAPTFAIAAWALAIGIAIEFGLPVQEFRPWVWALSAGLAVAGASRLTVGELRDNGFRIVLAIGLPAAALAGYLYYGLASFPGSPAFDGWSYIAFGEYLNRYPKGTEGGLAPLYQYAAHLAHTRYIASAMLALMIPPRCAACDTQASAGPFLALSAFAFSAACVYAGRLVFRRGWYELLYVSLCLGGGWFVGALRANNFDNILALPFMPSAVAMILLSGVRPRQYALSLAVLVAAAVYVYPELVPIFALGLALAVLNAALREKAFRHYALLTLAVVLVAGVLVAPFGSDLVSFFRNQLAAGAASSGPRPGLGGFPALFNWRLFPIVIWSWAFEPGNWRDIVIYGAVSSGLILGLAVGLAVAWRRGLFSISVFCVAALVLALVMVVRYRYDYGAYKMLLYGWWAIALATAIGAQAIVQWTRRLGSIGNLVRLTVGVGLVTPFWMFALGIMRFYHGVPATTIEPYRDLLNIERVTAGAPLEASIGAAVPNMWAVYFLRHVPVRFSEYLGYMHQAHVAPFMARSRAVSFAKPQFLLTERQEELGYEIAWQNARYTLWRLHGAPIVDIRRISAPNGMEVLAGKPFFWIGMQGATIELQSAQSARVTLTFELRPGPQLEALRVPRTLAVAVDGVSHTGVEIDRTKQVEIPLLLHAGVTSVVLSVPTFGQVPKPQGADPRILLAGVRGLRFAARPVRTND